MLSTLLIGSQLSVACSRSSKGERSTAPGVARSEGGVPQTLRHCGYVRAAAPHVTGAVPIANQAAALDVIVKGASYPSLLAAAEYVLEQGDELLPQLADLVTDRRYVGLEHTFDLFIPVRAGLGDIEDHGHGTTVQDDLFIVAGRANWILEETTCRTFGSVDLQTKSSRLKLISSLWHKHLNGEPVGVPYGSQSAPDRIVSRSGIRDAIAALALINERQRRARASGDDETARRATLEGQLRANGLRAATGLDYGTDAGAWDKWNLEAAPYLFFDWRRMQMRVSVEAQRSRKPLVDENLLVLPQ